MHFPEFYYTFIWAVCKKTLLTAGGGGGGDLKINNIWDQTLQWQAQTFILTPFFYIAYWFDFCIILKHNEHDCTFLYVPLMILSCYTLGVYSSCWFGRRFESSPGTENVTLLWWDYDVIVGKSGREYNLYFHYFRTASLIA